MYVKLLAHQPMRRAHRCFLIILIGGLLVLAKAPTDGSAWAQSCEWGEGWLGGLLGSLVGMAECCRMSDDDIDLFEDRMSSMLTGANQCERGNFLDGYRNMKGVMLFSCIFERPTSGDCRDARDNLVLVYGLMLGADLYEIYDEMK